MGQARTAGQVEGAAGGGEGGLAVGVDDGEAGAAFDEVLGSEGALGQGSPEQFGSEGMPSRHDRFGEPVGLVAEVPDRLGLKAIASD